MPEARKHDGGRGREKPSFYFRGTMPRDRLRNTAPPPRTATRAAASALLLLLLAAAAFVDGFSTARRRRDRSTSASNHRGDDGSIVVGTTTTTPPRVVIVGKIILDVYGDPVARRRGDGGGGRDARAGRVTIGGGGPQAAWGACASLAARDLWRGGGDGELPRRGGGEGGGGGGADASPPRQDVTFLAPVGLRNWTPSMTDALGSLLPMLRTPPILATSDDHATPTINIWHDEDETVRWTPVDDSFGAGGADGLWRDRPSARDVLDAIDEGGGVDGSGGGGDGDHDMIVLHAILEAGRGSAGGGLDASPFLDPRLAGRVALASVEPIVFPDGGTGAVSPEDAGAVRSLVDMVAASLSASRETTGYGKERPLLVISPDRPCYDALVSSRAEHLRPPRGSGDDVDDGDDDDESASRGAAIEFAVRDGANGSVAGGVTVPPAALVTPDSRPVDPTGAGNAYSGAYAACRGTGSTIEEAACLASAVGAVVCEHENLPLWTWEVLGRVVEAASEVRGKMV